MNKTILQHIIMPSDGNMGVTPLYAKGCGNGFPAIIPVGDGLDLRTFFNFFPSGKYRKFTDIDEVWLELECEGNPTVTVFRYANETTTSESFIYEGSIRIPLADEDLIGITLEATGSNVTLFSGCFFVNKDVTNDIRLAHIICTYRMERELKSKLDLITDVCARYPVMKEKLRIYVVDNANTFDYTDDNVSIIKSKNYGGSGGFSRGLIEAINDGISTHIILNDDDAMLDPESIYRTIMFYSFLTDCNKKIILGGVTFEKDRPLSVHEAGWFFRNGEIVLNKPGDFTTADGCVSLERTVLNGKDNAYFAWCYMSTSCEVIRDKGLSLPLFFQCDDTDFGLRTKEIPKVIMCGISVWHPFGSSHSVNKSYYRTRNMLVVLASNGLLDRSCMKNLLYNSMVNVGCFRYRTAEAQLQAIRDFKKGPEQLFPITKEGPIRFDEYKFEEPKEDGRRINSKTPRHSRPFYIITLNGVLFPSNGDVEVDMTTYESYQFYRKKRAYCRSSDGREVVLERSRRKTIRLVFSTTIELFRMYLRRRRYNRDYSQKAPFYYTEEKWREVFGIDDE